MTSGSNYRDSEIPTIGPGKLVKHSERLREQRSFPHLINQELLSIQYITARKSNFRVREKAQSNAEVDLLYPCQHVAIPIEIKSGPTGTLKSLHQFIDKADHPYAIRMYAGELKLEKAITPTRKPYLLLNLPYYLGTLIPEYAEWLIQQEI